MNLKRPGRLAYFLPVAAIAVLIILLVSALFRLVAVQREMQVNANANMVWVVYQAQVETLRLGQALQQAQLKPDSDARLAFRYKIWLSRIHLFEDGPQVRVLHALGFDREISEQASGIREFAPQLLSESPDEQTINHLVPVLNEFSRLLSAAGSKAMLAQWDEAGAQLDRYRRTVFTILLLMVGIVLCSGFISIRLLYELKKSTEAEAMRQREVQLKKQLEMERQVREMYRNFGAMVSHQFRTPLAIIDACLQRLIRGADKMTATEISRRASRAHAATGRLSALIESLLETDRFLDQVKVHLQVCRLTEVAAQVMADYQGFHPHRQLSLTDETNGADAVECDPVLTTEILANIVSNALNYSADDTAVDLRLYRESAWVCCDVIDRGRGIRAKDIPYVFNRYFRTWSTSDVAGTGVGLHIASELASLQKGEILVHSTPGVGSVFTLRFPAVPLKT